MPEREVAWCAQMKQMNPEFEYRCFGNEIMEQYGQDPYVREMMSRGEPLAFVTDRLRCLILRDQGGIWLDPDCQPVRPLNRLNHVWADPRITFVHSVRDPQRQNVHLHRGITLVDDTFLASAPGSRMINRVLEVWAPSCVRVDGHGIGVQILKYTDADTCNLNYRYFYALKSEPETLVLHDATNLASWCDEHKQRKLQHAAV